LSPTSSSGFLAGPSSADGASPQKNHVEQDEGNYEILLHLTGAKPDHIVDEFSIRHNNPMDLPDYENNCEHGQGQRRDNKVEAPGDPGWTTQLY
jgi:hypothetical protein